MVTICLVWDISSPSPSESVVGNLCTLWPFSLSLTCPQPVTIAALLPLTLKLEAVQLKR